jgi:hypothetical protein
MSLEANIHGPIVNFKQPVYSQLLKLFPKPMQTRALKSESFNEVE